MSALQRSISSRLLPSALRSAPRAVAPPQFRTFASKEAPIKTSPEDAPTSKQTTESTQIREASAAEGIRHQPDYNVAIDYRTSYVAAAHTPAHDG